MKEKGKGVAIISSYILSAGIQYNYIRLTVFNKKR